jgi:translation initiation factor IF-1
MEAGSSRAERTAEGVVMELLPSGLYQVVVDGGGVTAHIGGGSERNFVRVLVGDRVVIELTPRDLTRGRIVRKL